MTQSPKFKDYFNEQLAQMLAEKIKLVYPLFDRESFIREVVNKIRDREFKARVAVFTEALYEGLPQDYGAAMEILLGILGPENPNETGMFTNWYWLMPVAFYIEKYGTDDLELSLKAIYEITKRNTGEYAIRPFITKFPDQVIPVLINWSTDESFHVRRLASEGMRPRLPWAQKLAIFIKDPTPIFPILENLKRDPSKFVQKSVANNINDILKDNYQMGINLLQTWAEEESITKNTQWIIKHALRNERKKENGVALWPFSRK